MIFNTLANVRAILHSNLRAVAISRTCLLLTRLAIKIRGVLSDIVPQLAVLLQFWDTRTTHSPQQRSASTRFARIRRLTLWIRDYGCFTNPLPSSPTVLADWIERSDYFAFMRVVQELLDTHPTAPAGALKYLLFRPS